MKECQVCKKMFAKDKWYRQRTFCSNSCSTKWKRANQIIPDKPRKGTTLNCRFCGEDFYVPRYRAKKAKYCSRSCLAKVHLSQFSDKWFKPSGKPRAKYKTISIEGRKIREHRYIMEQHIGRKLESWEHVHHINGDSLDNRIENLEVLSNSEHQKKHRRN